MNATVTEVCQWLVDGVFRVEDGKVFKGEKELAQRINKRKGSERGDPRVDHAMFPNWLGCRKPSVLSPKDLRFITAIKTPSATLHTI